MEQLFFHTLYTFIYFLFFLLCSLSYIIYTIYNTFRKKVVPLFQIQNNRGKMWNILGTNWNKIHKNPNFLFQNFVPVCCQFVPVFGIVFCNNYCVEWNKTIKETHIIQHASTTKHHQLYTEIHKNLSDWTF